MAAYNHYYCLQLLSLKFFKDTTQEYWTKEQIVRKLNEMENTFNERTFWGQLNIAFRQKFGE